LPHDAGPPPPPPGTCADGAYSEVEPNDLATQANPLLLGTTCGTLEVGSDVDWFTFDLGAAGATATIAFQSDGDAYMAIAGLGSNGSYVGKAGFSTTFKGTGQFYVRIYSPGAVQQSYAVIRSQ
jgi:hypothetical protein